MGTHASSVALDMLNVNYVVAYLNVYLFMLLVMHWHYIGVYVLGRIYLYFVGFVRLRICDIYKSLFIYPTRINS